MSYQFYKILHVLSLATLFISLGWLLLASRIKEWNSHRKVGLILHGTSLFFLLLSGFGLAARLGLVTGLPPWIHIKVTIWFLLGVSILLIKKLDRLWVLNLILILVLTGLAAGTAVYKPF